ncbi:MAG: response regulator [Bdellovibrionales bacterium]
MKKSDINILVVDDDASFRSAMAEAFKRFGYKANVVAKAEDALNAVKIKQYHAALIDCMLPRQNGVDLAKEMRRTRFAHAPIILMSGVFKDRSFASEAIEKTKSIEFLNKPFDLKALKEILDAQFAKLLSPDNVPLHVLVSKPFSSARERTKVIEGLAEVRGFDLPFVLCVLIDAGASGHLNIANSSGEIYGISFLQGKIISVDSSEKEATILMLLLEMGYLNREDLKTVQNSGRRGDLIPVLIENQFVSPHVLPLVSKEQIASDLKRLFVNDQFNVNFVPDPSKKEVEFGVTMDDITPLLVDVVDHGMTLDYLRDFYKDWHEFPIQVGPIFKPDHPLFKLELFARLPKLAQYLGKQMTIDELRGVGNYDEWALYKCLHLMTFRRMIIFDDVKKVKGAAEHGDRMRLMLKDLQGKNPFQIFAYFGVSEGAKEQEIEKVYREFARANHPDLLSPAASTEMRKTVNQVFSIVSEAHDLLVNPEKRQKLINDLKQREAEEQIQAESLVDEAINYLRRGRVKEALEKTTKAFKSDAPRGIKIAHAWALLKSKDDVSTASEVSKILESIPHEERRTAQYAFVSGLLKKTLGDNHGAATQFDKAIAMDPNFLEARREKSAINGQSEKVDIFKTDISKLVGNMFKKRK